MELCHLTAPRYTAHFHLGIARFNETGFSHFRENLYYPVIRVFHHDLSRKLGFGVFSYYPQIVDF